MILYVTGIPSRRRFWNAGIHKIKRVGEKAGHTLQHGIQVVPQRSNRRSLPRANNKKYIHKIAKIKRNNRKNRQNPRTNRGFISIVTSSCGRLCGVNRKNKTKEIIETIKD